MQRSKHEEFSPKELKAKTHASASVGSWSEK
jgi:hypothetical protein